MPMERSVSCADRSAAYARVAPANDLRCHSASYPASYAPVPAATADKVVRARSTGLSSLSRRGTAAPAVQRSGSTRTVAAGPKPGLNLRCYSASYAASYSPFSVDGAAAQVKPARNTGTTTTWSSAGRRSLNLRGYTPSFAALVNDDDDPRHSPTPANPGGGGLDDAELQRKKRLVAYKVYDVEGKVKISVRRGVKWIKGKCSRAVHGW